MKIILFSILLFLIEGFKSPAFSQYFYAQYKSFELAHVKKAKENIGENVLISKKENVSFLKLTADAYKRKFGYSFFAVDSAFIITLVDTANVNYCVVLSGKRSCYYRYKTVSGPGGKMSFKGFKYYLDASSIMEKLPERIKTWMLGNDTANFKKYAGDMLAPPFCCVIIFIKAVKTGNYHWKFKKTASAHFIDL